MIWNIFNLPVNGSGEDEAIQKKDDSMTSFFIKLYTLGNIVNCNMFQCVSFYLYF